MRDEGGREADGGPVERGDEDLRVRVEGAGDVEVVGREGLQGGAAGVGGGGGGQRARDGEVGAGGEVAAGAGEEGDGDVGAGGDEAEELGEVVVVVLG